jgi:hypothetical protein
MPIQRKEKTRTFTNQRVRHARLLSIKRRARMIYSRRARGARTSLSNQKILSATRQIFIYCEKVLINGQ